MKQVVISVSGGVADIAYASAGVEVAIVDFDDAEARGKSGKHALRYWVAQAKRDEKTRAANLEVPDLPPAPDTQDAGDAMETPVEYLYDQDGRLLQVEPYRLSRLFEAGQEMVLNSVPMTVLLCTRQGSRVITRVQLHGAWPKPLPPAPDAQEDEPWEPRVCVRCGGPVLDGRCADQTCPFSDHDQTCPNGMLGHPEGPRESGPCACAPNMFRDAGLWQHVKIVNRHAFSSRSGANQREDMRRVVLDMPAWVWYRLFSGFRRIGRDGEGA